MSLRYAVWPAMRHAASLSIVHGTIVPRGSERLTSARVVSASRRPVSRSKR
ncbi:Uncharacterised protein [Mycobacteroides abscessus subsp. abscessus]|nr:Uncharacterised protein [Mycobacteroides abscessus subsp. abscessus]